MDHVRIRLVGALGLVVMLTLSIVGVEAMTGKEPVRLYDALLVLVGYICRDATTRPAGNDLGKKAPPAEVKS